MTKFQAPCEIISVFSPASPFSSLDFFSVPFP